MFLKRELASRLTFGQLRPSIDFGFAETAPRELRPTNERRNASHSCSSHIVIRVIRQILAVVAEPIGAAAAQRSHTACDLHRRRMPSIAKRFESN